MPIIPDIWEPEVGRSQAEAGLGKSVRCESLSEKQTKSIRP
jgi:hypothetical protein